MSTKKKEKFSLFISNIPHGIWVLLSAFLFILVWKLISMTESGGVVFASPWEIVQAAVKYAKKGLLWTNAGASLYRVLTGFLIGFVAAVPIAFLMGWYKTFRLLVEPWIQFIRNIPPIAYIPLVIVAAGVGEKAKIVVIFIASFLTMVITIYQGVLNVDETLIKAGRVLGANDRVMFFKIVVPASTPFIITALRLGLSSSLTTLVAAEMTGASMGLGTMIQTSSQYFEMDVVLMGIVIIGIIGLVLQNVVKLLEKKVTGWQEKRIV